MKSDVGWILCPEGRPSLETAFRTRLTHCSNPMQAVYVFESEEEARAALRVARTLDVPYKVRVTIES